jgi:hypothetical protein
MVKNFNKKPLRGFASKGFLFYRHGQGGGITGWIIILLGTTYLYRGKITGGSTLARGSNRNSGRT